MTRFTYRWTTSLLIAVAVGLALLPLTELVRGWTALVEAWVLLMLVGTTGSVLALFRLPRTLIWVAQLLIGGGYIVVRGVVLSEASDPLAGVRDLAQSGLAAVQRGVPPLEAVPGVVWLVLSLAIALVLVIELLVNLLEQSAWSAAPLALVFAVAAITVRAELSWGFIIPLVLAYCILLASTTGFGQDASGEAVHRVQRIGAKAALTLLCALLSVGGALAAAPLVPANEKQAWTSSDNSPIQLSDPTIRLEQDLRRPTDSPVLTYTTNNGEPVYMRTVAMSSLTTKGAQLLPMDLARYSIGGAYNFDGTRVEVSVQMAEITSEYLPAPFAVDSINAEGGWSYDPTTMSVVASGAERARQTVGLKYSVVSTVPTPSREQIQQAKEGALKDRITLQVPEGISQGVRDLTESVTSGAPTAGEKALSIQAYLRSSEFTYTLNAPETSSADAITAFLLESKSGYCVHFAAAMITMARISGIPARLAVGFAPGDKREDGSYEITAHDAHAWPELYFDGLGWVPFEPTPAYEGNNDYTDPAAVPEPTDSATPTQSEVPAPPTPTDKMSLGPTPTLSETGDDAESSTSASSSGGVVQTVLMWLGGALGVALLMASPMLIRFGLTWMRLRPRGGARATSEAVWRETEDALVDYGYPRMKGTPGPAALPITGFLTDEASASLRRIAATVERNRFARDEAPVDALDAQFRSLRQSLKEHASRRERLLAVLWPASLVRRLSPLALLRRLRGA